MKNESGLKPLGVAVLLEPYEPERRGALIQLPSSVADKVAMVDNRAIVVEIGPSAWNDEPHPRAKVGDKVLVTKYAGYMVEGTLDGKRYRLVNDRDLFCGIDAEREVA